MGTVNKSWSDFFKKIQGEPYCESLNKFLNNEYQEHTCYPPRELLFNAFNKIDSINDDFNLENYLKDYYFLKKVHQL